MNNTSYWICDKCGKKIESTKDGWVEWLIPTKNNVLKVMQKMLIITYKYVILIQKSNKIIKIAYS